jgi:hypothetical protein
MKHLTKIVSYDKYRFHARNHCELVIFVARVTPAIQTFKRFWSNGSVGDRRPFNFFLVV